MSKLRPLHDRIIVKRLEKDSKTKSGIIIPDSAKEKPKEGKVISVGTGRIESDGKVTPLTVKEGDVVLFSSYAGNEIKIDGDELLIMHETEVLAIIE